MIFWHNLRKNVEDLHNYEVKTIKTATSLLLEYHAGVKKATSFFHNRKIEIGRNDCNSCVSNFVIFCNFPIDESP